MAGYALVRLSGLSLEEFATRAGMHPDLVRRLVALGLLEPVQDTSGQWWFAAPQLRAAARIQRLRAGLSLNYAALGLVIDLLDRIDALEATLRATGARPPRDAARGPSATARCED
ncbi:MAG: MerR family transcriptional regulator [Pseudonocardia sp.]|nr:MerR family transcriptional regulator [Pseudonocardia sp.]